MAHTSAFGTDDPSLYQVRRKPRKRASASTWVLRATTTCLALAGTLVLLDVFLNWSALLTARNGRSADPTPVAVFIADQRLTIPANMIRFEDQRSVGPHQRVDLAVHWPSLTGYEPEKRKAFLDPSSNAPLLFLTIRVRETATDSAGRLANVYQHFFDGPEIPAPRGLVGHRLSEDSGLAGEEVYFEAGSTQPFTVHCLADDGSGYPAPCLTELHAGEQLSIQIRFRKGLLEDWAAIRKSSRALLASFGVLS